MPAFAANIGLLGGVVIIAVGYFLPAAAERVDSMHEFHFLGAVFATLIAAMLLLRAWRPRAEAWQQHDSRAVDLTPWRHASWVGFALLVVVISIYAWFADVDALQLSENAR